MPTTILVIPKARDAYGRVNQPVRIDPGETGTVVLNPSNQTVYYKSTADVSDISSDGTLAQNATLNLPTTEYFLAAERTEITVSTPPTLSPPLAIGQDLGPNTGSTQAALLRVINPVTATDNTSTVYHFAVGDGTKYQHMNGQGVGVVGGLYFAVEDSTSINGSVKLTVNQTGQNDGTLQASSITGKTPGLYLRAISHVRIQAGFLANSTFDTASFTLVQSGAGLAVQDTAGSNTYFWVNPNNGGKIGFYGATPVVKGTVSGAKGSNAALGSLMTALSALGLVTDSTTA